MAGPLGYFRGMQARVLYQMPAAAICWSTYEFFKYVLLGEKGDNRIDPKEPIFAEALNLRLVLPQTNMAEDKSSDIATSTRNCNDISGLKTRELPAVSGAHVYGALSLNTMHTENNSINNTTSRLRNDSMLFDIRS